MIGDGGVLRGFCLVTGPGGRVSLESTIGVAEREAVRRAIARTEPAVPMLGAGAELAAGALQEAREAVELKAPAGDGYVEPRANPEARAFAAWFGAALLGARARWAGEALLAACTAAGSCAVGDFAGARMLAEDSGWYADKAEGG